jgi:hypothetical protein
MPRKKKEDPIINYTGILTSKEKSIFRKTKQWIEFRNATIQKKGNKCELCGYEKRLTLHHIYLNDSAESYTNLSEERFKVLDANCHKWLHQIERSYHRKKNPTEPEDRIKSILDEFIIVEK